MGAGYVTKIDSRHRVILTIDDQRVFQQEAGGPEDLKYVDQQQAIAADNMQARFNHIRVRVPAGMHRIGVAFVERSYAQSDSPLQPIAMLPEMERYPNIPGFDVSGPFNVNSVGETPSRQRIFVCRPASQAEEAPCARRILSRLASEAFRRPASRRKTWPRRLQFYASGRAAGGFEAGIESGLTAILASTKFLFRVETSAAQAVDVAKAAHRSGARLAAVVLPVERGPGPEADRSRGSGAPARAGSARRRSAPHAGGSALGNAGDQLRLPVAERAADRQDPARPGAVSRPSTRTCARAFARRSGCSSTACCAPTAACSTCCAATPPS